MSKNLKENGAYHWYECDVEGCTYMSTPGLSYSGAVVAGNAHKRGHIAEAKRQKREQSRQKAAEAVPASKIRERRANPLYVVP